MGGGEEKREGRSKGETGTRPRKRHWEKEDGDGSGSRLKTDGEVWARKHPQPRQGGRGTHGPWP